MTDHTYFAKVGSMAFQVGHKFPTGFYTNIRGKKKFIPYGMRKEIVTFSTHARRNFLWRLQTLDYDRLVDDGYVAYFITLTYRKDFFDRKRNMKLAKRDLDRLFRYELKKEIGDDWFCFWKLEFHQSGIPHFHLFFITSIHNFDKICDVFNRAWVNSACFDADPETKKLMFRASVNVLYSPLNLKQVLMVYVSKEVGKDYQVEVKSDELPGRFWGVYNRKLYKKYIKEDVYEISLDVFYTIRRILRRWAKSRGFKLKSRGHNGLRVFYISNILDFERLLSYYGVFDRSG